MTSTRSDANDEFVRQYTPFVKHIVAHTSRQIGFAGDEADLEQFAFEGLLDARKRYDRSQGVQFKSFAYYRVRGAVLDGVRSMSKLSRREFAKLKAAQAVDDLSEPYTRPRMPQRPVGVAAAVRGLDSVLGRVAAAYCAAVALDERDEDADSPEVALIARQQSARVRRAIEKLPERERFLVEGYYLQGKRLDALSKELGISKSRGSHIHAHALGLLREALSEA